MGVLYSLNLLLFGNSACLKAWATVSTDNFFDRVKSGEFQFKVRHYFVELDI
jgi:hypothetical protein